MAVTMRTVAEAIGADPDLVADEQKLIDARATLYNCEAQEVTFDTVSGTIRRRLRSMRLGKRIAEDWASLLWTENARVVAGEDDSPEQLYLDAVLGERYAPLIGEAVERSMGLGTTGIDLLFSVRTNWLGYVIPFGGTPVLDVTDAYGVIPLSFDKTGITEVAFVSYGKNTVMVREHRKGFIRNRAFSAPNGSMSLVPMALPEGMQEEVRCDIPLFAVMKPAIASSARVGYPYGASPLDAAQDHIRVADLCFDNFGEDFALGGKKVFVSESLLEKDAAGNYQTPDRSRTQMYLSLRDPIGEGDFKSGIREHNPDLRVADNRQGINTALSLVSSAVGFGDGYYSFDGDAGLKTATEVVAQNSDLYRMRRKHWLAVSSAMEQLARAALYVGNVYGGQRLDVNAEIRVISDDSVIEDDTARQNRGLELYRAGVMSKYRFLTEYMHYTEEEARAEVNETALTIAGLV